MSTGSSSWRYERKYYLEDITRAEVELALKHHPAFFSEIYHQRVINNIYLDDPGHSSYYDNVEGNPERSKVRIRWYGDMQGTIREPILEIKSRRGELGSKRSFPLPPFVVDTQLSDKTLAAVLTAAELPAPVLQQVSALFPAILNRYSRRYFRSLDRALRATVDSDLTAFALGPLLNFFSARVRFDPDVVLELKYAPRHDLVARRAAGQLPYRMTRSSKYVMGSAYTIPGLQAAF